MKPDKLHLVTVVWGKKYRTIFLEYSLPSQLFEGNLTLFSKEEICYEIYTTEEDRKEIENALSFQALQLIASISFHLISLPKTFNVFYLLNRLHTDALQRANAINAAIVFLTPDIFFCKCSFYPLKTAKDTGLRALFSSALRLNNETLFSQHSFVEFRSFTRSEMIQHALTHLHPVSLALLWESQTLHSWSSQIYWRLGPHSLLVRSFHQHPIYIWPEKKDVLPRGSIDGDYVYRACPAPSSWKIVTDSDEMAVFEISNPDSISISLRKKSFYRLAFWVVKHADVSHRLLAKQKLFIHANSTSSREYEKIAESDRVIEHTISLAESKNPLFWIYFAARRAKELLSSAISARR